MSTRGVDELIWAALTDSALRARLLAGHIREVAGAFSLKEVERQALLAVEADTLTTFAAALCWLESCSAM